MLALPDTLDQMTIAVEAGLGFDAAMAKAAREWDRPARRRARPRAAGHEHRSDPSRCLPCELEHAHELEDLRRFIRAVVQADPYGIAIGDVLRVQAGEMRLKRRQRAEEQARRSR